MNRFDAQISKIAEKSKTAKKICVLTGAGISAESGVPTFRGGGNSAVWKGMPFDVISSAKMLREDLDAVWEWFDYRRGVLKNCQPNAAHFALAKWQDRFENFTLVTQNIDGFHQAAGSRDVIELHGGINRARCENCNLKFEIERDEVPHKPETCSKCGAKLRPDVVLFGEFLPEGAFERAALAAANCDLFFIVGTSAVVYPAAALPEIARQAGAFLVEINLEQTPLSEICDVSLQGKAGEILPLLDKF